MSEDVIQKAADMLLEAYQTGKACAPVRIAQWSFNHSWSWSSAARYGDRTTGATGRGHLS